MEPEKKKRGASVGLRWLTAIIAMPIVLLFVWFGGWVAFVALALVVCLGIFELHTMLRKAGYRPVLWISLGLSFVFLIAAMFPDARTTILEFGLGIGLILSLSCLLFRRQYDGSMVDWAFSLATAFYLGWPMSYFALLRGYQVGMLHLAAGSWIFIPRGAWWLLVVFACVWSFDGAAFFSGRYLGRHKLAPRISPGKTWEGVGGGLVMSIIAALVMMVFPLGVPWYLAVVLGVCVGVAATFGDLAESLMKRQMHVKDSGQIMPGHGGMLDRVDSLLFAVIVVYMFAQFFPK